MNSWQEQAWTVALWLVLGLPLVFLASHFAGKGLSRLGRAHASMVVRRVILYFGLLGIVTSILLALKVDLTGWLATAGIATIAIGFAAQTSLSNYISGLFLIGERTFRVGDLLRVGTTTGVVESIDMLSVKLRSLDNLYVRIPNEELLKSQTVTVTRFPIRRMDLVVRVTFEAPLERVREILREVAEANPHCLREPAPLILVDELSEQGFNIRFGVWFEKTRYVDTRNALFVEMQRRFLEERIRFQLPRMVMEDIPSSPSKVVESSDI